MSLVARGRRIVRRRNPGRSAAAAESAGRLVPPAPRSASNSGSRTALQKHVDFFDTNHFDTNHDGKIRSPTRTADFGASALAPSARPRLPAWMRSASAVGPPA